MRPRAYATVWPTVSRPRGNFGVVRMWNEGYFSSHHVFVLPDFVPSHPHLSSPCVIYSVVRALPLLSSSQPTHPFCWLTWWFTNCPPAATVLASSLLGLAFLLIVFKRITRRKNVVAFFHPYCNDGGGGERVLWCAVQALHASRPDCAIAVYTGDAASKEDILRKAKERFGLDVDAVNHAYSDTYAPSPHVVFKRMTRVVLHLMLSANTPLLLHSPVSILCTSCAEP